MARPDTRETHDAHGILTAIAPGRWAPSVFGVVDQARIRRRPGDVVRVALSVLLVILTASASDRFTTQERRMYDFVNDLPSWFRSAAEVGFSLTTVGAIAVILLALLLTRRWQVALRVVAAGAGAWLVAIALRAVVDSDSVREAAGLAGHHPLPQYPVVQLMVATAVLLVVAPFLVRPARRCVNAVVALAAVCGVLSIEGLPIDVVAALAVGWGVAAVVHLAAGTPAATPTLPQVAGALHDLGVTVGELHLADEQVWGETRFVARGPSGEPVSVDVIARDAADARLLSKVTRALLYRDSGPSLALTRPQQLEHRAYVLLLAGRTGVPVSEVVIAGMAGSNADALLVLRDPAGAPMPAVESARVTDAVLDDAWANLARLHGARLSHGRLMAANVLVRDDATTAIVDFAYGSAGAPPERLARDRVELLVTTAVVVGDERSLAAAYRALGRDGLGELLPLIESSALSAVARHRVEDRKKLLADLREQGAALAGEEVPKLTELHRVSWGQIVMAAATFLGFYLIVAQFAGVDLWATLQDAQWEWVVVAALLSPLPQFTGAISLQGSVAAPLPYGPVVAEQFANNFTGLIGGTLATTALVIRFFQKQGQKVAVAASSGVLNSLASGIVQVTLVTVGLLFTTTNFAVSDTGSGEDGSDLGRIIVIGILLGGVAIGIAFAIPKLRHLVHGIVAPQMKAAKDNLRGILSTPRKATMLFGGNLASQVIFALVLDASLHAYGYSLPLMELIIINSLASVLGGLAPVPGGMGVVEAGLIGGLTAAGIPQNVAVATTFTHRLFTAYLPPIWGWFALQWLRHNDYV